MIYDTDNLLKQVKLGQAYINITDELGPDPQLIAFVNYDSFAGFESLDMFSQHLEILDQINNDPAFDLALEGLGTNIKEAIVGRLSNIGYVGEHPSKQLDKVSSANLVINDKNSHTRRHDEIVTLLAVRKKAFRLMQRALALVPKSADIAGWNKLHDEQIAIKTDDVLHDRQELKSLKWEHSNTTGVVPFSVSGWTSDNFKQAVREFKSNEDEIHKTLVQSEKRYVEIEGLWKRLNLIYRKNKVLQSQNKEKFTYVKTLEVMNFGFFLIERNAVFLSDINNAVERALILTSRNFDAKDNKGNLSHASA
jgi:hypothetical protein